MSIKRTIITTVVALALVAVVAPVSALALTAGCSLTNTSACNATDLQQLVAQLSASLSGLTGTTAAPTSGACAGVTFSRNLKVGSVGADVKCMQTILNAKGFTVATTGAGSPGNETSTFGPRTLVAVKKYQAAKGFTPANQVGPMTRQALTADLGGGTIVPVGPVSSNGAVSAMVASDNPASGAIVGGQAQAALLNVNFTGTGTVTSVTLQRSGISDASLFTNVYLYDGNTRLTSGYSFNTNGTLTINGLNVVVNGSHEISVRGDVANTGVCTGGGSITTCESSVAVTLTSLNGSATNVMGNTMTVASGTLATADFGTVSSLGSPTSTTINAGSTNQTLWSYNINIGSRAVSLYGLTVKMVGSAPTNTLANVALYVDGTQVTTATINSNNQYVFSVSSPMTLTTGQHLLEVHGDVVGGATRSFYLSLEQGSDVVLKDTQLGVFIAATKTSGTQAATNVNSGTIALGGVINGSSNLTINKDASFNNTTTLVGGVTNTTLASFTFTAYGEDTKVTDLTFTPTFTTGRDANAHVLSTLSNVGLYINGGQVGQTKTATSGSPLSFNSLGSQILIPVGTTVTVSLKGDMVSSATDANGTTSQNQQWASGTVEFDVQGYSTQGVYSGTTSVLPVSPATTVGISGQSLTVSSSNVTLAPSLSYAASTLAPGTTAELGDWSLATGSAEGVTLNTIRISLPTTVAGANDMATNNQLSNLVLKVNGTVVGSPVNQPSTSSSIQAGSNNFSLSGVTVPANGTADIQLWGTVGSSTAATYHVFPYIDAIYTGSTSHLTTTYSVAANSNNYVAGVEGSTGTPTISASDVTTSTSLTSQYVTGNAGASPLAIATFNVKADVANGTTPAGATLRDLTFTTVSNSIASVTVNGITRSVSNNTVTIPNVNLTVPGDPSGRDIPVTAQLVCVGSGCSGTSGSNVKLSLTALTYFNGSAVQPVNSITTATTAVNQLVSTIPTVALTSNPNVVASTLSNNTNLIVGSFTVTTGTTGSMKIQRIPVLITGTTGVSFASATLLDGNGGSLTNTPSLSGITCSGTSCTGYFDWGSTPFTLSTTTPSQAFTVAVSVSGTDGTSNTKSLVFSLDSANKGTNFLWTDVTGAKPNLTGQYINGYPTGSQTIHN